MLIQTRLIKCPCQLNIILLLRNINFTKINIIVNIVNITNNMFTETLASINVLVRLCSNRTKMKRYLALLYKLGLFVSTYFLSFSPSPLVS